MTTNPNSIPEYSKWILLSYSGPGFLHCPKAFRKNRFPAEWFWKVVRRGTEREEEFPARFIQQSDTCLLHDSVYTLTAESVDKGVVHYANGRMDIYGKEGVNAGKHFTAIYKQAGLLSICYNLKGDGYLPAFHK
ncbi:MAG: hypothetical protein U0T82_01230 [Bacteroidales bacterium]